MESNFKFVVEYNKNSKFWYIYTKKGVFKSKSRVTINKEIRKLIKGARNNENQ